MVLDLYSILPYNIRNNYYTLYIIIHGLMHGNLLLVGLFVAAAALVSQECKEFALHHLLLKSQLHQVPFNTQAC